MVTKRKLEAFAGFNMLLYTTYIRGSVPHKATRCPRVMGLDVVSRAFTCVRG